METGDERLDEEPREALQDDDGPENCSAGHNQALGKRGEEASVCYLEHLGYEIIDRNWTCPAGEVDIVAFDEGTLVFIEVKTRSDIMKGLPAEAVTAEKRARYEKIATWYLKYHDILDVPVRFDVIGLLVADFDRALMRHYVNAFGGGI